MLRPRSTLASGIALAFTVALAATGAHPVTAATVTPGYDAIPTALPGNLSSIGYESGRINELGDHISLAGTERDAADLPVTVVMSVWACGNGGLREGCSTEPGQTFSQPITLNLYEVDTSGTNPALGDRILSATQTFTLAFRPSPDPAHCPSSGFYPWYSAADNTCFSGFAQEITFDLSAFNDVLPDSLIWGIAFNGQVSGYEPIGTQGPWNFLNLGTKTYVGQPAYGTDVEQDAVFMSSHYAWWYADGGAGGIDTFRRDTSWANSRPLARFGVYTQSPPRPEACPSAPFTDVPVEHAFCPEILWAKTNNIANGWPDGTYRPENNITRMAMAAFLERLADGNAQPCTSAPFSDVPVDHTFCAEINWLKTNGITNGFADGTFRPEADVSRQAMAAFLTRIAGATPPACTEAPFPDVPVDHAFCKEITWIKDNAITTGFEDGDFHPGAAVTRQSMAAFLYRTSVVMN